MTRLSATPRAFSSRTGLRRTLVAYALCDVLEFAIWLAVILIAYDAGGAPLAAFRGRRSVAARRHGLTGAGQCW